MNWADGLEFAAIIWGILIGCWVLAWAFLWLIGAVGLIPACVAAAVILTLGVFLMGANI